MTTEFQQLIMTIETLAKTRDTTVDDVNPAFPIIWNIPRIPILFRVLKVRQGLYIISSIIPLFCEMPQKGNSEFQEPSICDRSMEA